MPNYDERLRNLRYNGVCPNLACAPNFAVHCPWLAAKSTKMSQKHRKLQKVENDTEKSNGLEKQNVCNLQILEMSKDAVKNVSLPPRKMFIYPP